ncbi:hypothetical protein R6U77_00955 [Lysinibacillus louembei]|uniref:Uncharacterized protein n=1 Tax=Lysinibacillus louembei TaxID=1470088 RepID=A0ABZ0RZR1_9BACI|nr:hypothetical protein [Lysinibacillus louembei]WPK12288.1 hypothetical protein R6U77_00955 [Lysinibacillus louembei]
MTIKNISMGDANFEVKTQIGEDCGFLFSLSSFYEDGKRDVAEVYIGVDEAKQIIEVLQDSIKFAESLNE